MRSRFNYHDFIAYIIPGLLPCLIGIFIIFARGHFRLFAFVQTFGGFLILLLFAYLLGHMLQAAGALFERREYFPHRFDPVVAYSWNGRFILTAEEFDKLLAKYEERFGVRPTSENLENPAFRESCFNQVRWAIRDETRAEYIRTLDGYYDMFRGLFVSFLLTALMAIPIGSKLLPVPDKPSFYFKIFLVILAVRPSPWVATIGKRRRANDQANHPEL